MGHIAPEDPYYKPDPQKDRYTRELLRLEAALAHASAERLPGEPVILMMHYPPFTSEGKPTAYSALIEAYHPDIVLYGHLHRAKEWEVAVQGTLNGVRYQLVAADYLGMKPAHILTVPGLAEPARNGLSSRDVR
jgi:predicted phosphohydrolase